MDEQALPGGFVTEVVRVGDTVRRTPPPDPSFVHELLRLFERRGWPGAPRFLGRDERGRDVLTFLPGHAAWAPEQPAAVNSPGLDDRENLIDTIGWWQDRCWRGIEAGAAAGNPAMARLRDRGAADSVRAAAGWVTRHRARLAAALDAQSPRGGSARWHMLPPTGTGSR